MTAKASTITTFITVSASTVTEIMTASTQQTPQPTCALQVPYVNLFTYSDLLCLEVGALGDVPNKLNSVTLTPVRSYYFPQTQCVQIAT